MPPKAKKKRASLKLDATGEIKDAETMVTEETKPVRQVVEVVEENDVPEAIETIKRDAEEIEDAVETIEHEVEKAEDALSRNDTVTTPVMEESEESKGSVQSLFTKPSPAMNPEITVVGKKGASLGVWVGAMLGVALAIGVSLILLIRGPSTLSFLQPGPTPTPTPTTEPTPTVSQLNKSDIKVSVLNGGGVVGAGGKMKTFLEEKGYTVVSVGNADEYTYENTEVLAKADAAEYAKLLTEDLKADYTIGSSSATVEDDADYDVQVIVGKEE